MEIIQGLRPGVFLRHNTYRIEKVLGQGGFGITYLAVDLNLDRYIAIKEFFPKDYCDRDDATSHVTLGTQGSKDFVNRLKAKFLKEARNIARFDNPNIIRIHAAFEENDTAYYVMDYIEGQTLAEIVRNTGPIPEAKALEYINKVGGALEYVHNHNVTHLDVKPANIIIRNADDEPILIDFGLAKQYDAKGNQTSTTPIGISHGYAPMEQYADGGIKVFSPQTDLYSLAATLYYILSGIVPPQATKLIEDALIFPQL
ncbi:MAG: serine/threonine protein kinase, partial [Muribaculaceae bacterium]|nr:serine/threonine protein kinase [Muribaculaceae bacterium]